MVMEGFIYQILDAAEILEEKKKMVSLKLTEISGVTEILYPMYSAR